MAFFTLKFSALNEVKPTPGDGDSGAFQFLHHPISFYDWFLPWRRWWSYARLFHGGPNHCIGEIDLTRLMVLPRSEVMRQLRH
jgi:hypothetical protein